MRMYVAIGTGSEQRVRPFTLYNLSDLAFLGDGSVSGVIFDIPRRQHGFDSRWD